MFSSQCCVALLSLLPPISSAQVLCFASQPSPQTIRLQFTLPADGSMAAFVRYERGSVDIPAVRLNEAVISQPGQLPATVETKFAELVDGQRTGQYVLTTQGGAVGDLVYTRQTDKKTTVFYEDHQATSDNSCSWGPQPRDGRPK